MASDPHNMAYGTAGNISTLANGAINDKLPNWYKMIGRDNEDAASVAVNGSTAHSSARQRNGGRATSQLSNGRANANKPAVANALS